MALNQDPQNATSGSYQENDCERFFWALTDANYNVLGLVDKYGQLVERYEYTPYGQRQVYSHGWIIADLDDDGDVDLSDLGAYSSETGPFPRSDMDGDGDHDLSDFGQFSGWYGTTKLSAVDPLVLYPRSNSFRTGYSWGASGEPLCSVGFQGKMHDEETGLIQYPARYLNPPLGRWNTRDSIGYPDGMNSYAAYHALRGGLDPFGLALYAFDGTWQTRKSNTNVTRFAALYQDGPRVYRPGIGNADDHPDRPGQIIVGGTGSTGSGRAKEMYERVVENYNNGLAIDNWESAVIDMIGFSRGGAEAINLANMIAKRGIPVKSENDIERSWRTHNRKSIREMKSWEVDDAGFRVPLSHGVCTYDFPAVRFLGTYDAVGSFGLGALNIHDFPIQFPDLGWNFQRPPNVIHFAAIRRLSDNRLGFRPIPVQPDSLLRPDASHGDVGSDIIYLRWMVSEARWAGVEMQDP